MRHSTRNDYYMRLGAIFQLSEPTVKRADARADTSAAERRIDELDDALYGLDDAEIAIVAGRA